MYQKLTVQLSGFDAGRVNDGDYPASDVSVTRRVPSGRVCSTLDAASWKLVLQRQNSA